MAKFGAIKRQHGRVQGLDALLDDIITRCPHVTRIVPGRMGRKRGKTPERLRIKYATGAASTADSSNADNSQESSGGGLKCIYTKAGSWQEVFLVCSDAAAAQQWLEKEGLAGE